MAEQDFKYIIQDFSKIYLGGKLTYQDLLDRDDVPFKFRAITAHYMMKEVDGGTNLENHMCYLKDYPLSYMVYKQLKIRLKVMLWEKLPGKKETWGYRGHTLTLDEFLENQDIRNRRDELLIEELIITKLALMSISF